MMLDTAPAVIAYIRRHGVLAHLSRKTGKELPKELDIIRIPGGVSNHVWRIDLGSTSFILKQPLRQLAVKEKWLSGTGRLDVEVAALGALSNWIPGSVPTVLFHDAEHKVCVIDAAKAGSVSWKSQMMEGTFHSATAGTVGKTLRDIHEKSRQAPGEIRHQFESVVFFQELRIDPFHGFVTSKHPDLEQPIALLVKDLLENRTCFVHGDYSPKNILVDPTGSPLVIDLEVAHWGNPVFDVAYCLGHLMLKGWHLGRAPEALESIEAYLDGYGFVPERLVNHLGLMLLARVDGKSTVEYLKDAAIVEVVRNTGRSMLLSQQNDPFAITDLISILEDSLA